MLAQYDAAACTHVMPLQYPRTGTTPSVQAWLEIAPDYALRVLVCTDCGQRCALDAPDALLRDEMLPEDWDAALAYLADIFEDAGFPAGDHTHCKPFADGGAAACREST